MLFREVISSSKLRGRFYRESWGKGEYAFVVQGDKIKEIINNEYGNTGQDGLDINSFLLRKDATGVLNAYVPTLDDYFADDWELAIKPSDYK